MNLADTKLWTALITPMNEDGEINLDEFASLIHRQDEADNGVLILGSTGEGLALSLEDKKKVVKTASSLSVDVPLMVGAGGFNLRHQIEWLEYCDAFDIDSFLLVTPLYAKPNVKGQTAWFKALLNAADKPCMVYNVPSRTGVKLNPRVLEALSDHSNLFGLKEASGSIADYQAFRKAAPEIPVYSGDDGLTPFFAAAGCHGLVSVMANVWPKATHRYLEWSLQGRGPELLPLWQECSAALFAVTNPIPTKVLLAEKGIIKSDRLRLPLTAGEIEDTEFLLEADKKVKQWYKSTM
ncbi:MAG TPA: 4-hydroxy-tetrahydrodipicolinate synthase [Balneolaceae bacterium]|nr:4-hydroxy-tetrahydrodipicolinate synthase [Balneolaceae bacterium]